MKVTLGPLGCMLFLALSAGETVGGLEGKRYGHQSDPPRDRWACEADFSPMGSITPCLEELALEYGYYGRDTQDEAFWNDYTIAFMEDTRREPLHKARVDSGIMVNTTEGDSPFSAPDFTAVGAAYEDAFEDLESRNSSLFWNDSATAFKEPELQDSLQEARVEARTATSSRKPISLRASTLVTRAAFLGAAALFYLVLTLRAKLKLLRERCDQLEKEKANWMFVDRPAKAVTQHPYEHSFQELKAVNATYRQNLLELHQQHKTLLSRKQSDIDQFRAERDHYARLLSTSQAQRREELEHYRRLLSASEEQRQDKPSELQELRHIAAAAEMRAEKAEEALRLQTEAAENTLKAQCQEAKAETQAMQQQLADRTGHMDSLQIEVLALRTKSAETRGELETRNGQIAVLKDEARAMKGKLCSLMHVQAKCSSSRRLAKLAGLSSTGSGMRDGGVAAAVMEVTHEPASYMECDAPQAVASGASEIACEMDCELPQAAAAVQCQMEVDAPQGAAAVQCQMEVDAPRGAAVPLQLLPALLFTASSCEMPQAGPLLERTASCEMAQVVDLVDASANLPAVPVTPAASTPETQQAPERPHAAPERPFVAPVPQPGHAGPALEPRRAAPFPVLFPATSPLLLAAAPPYIGPPSPPVRDAHGPDMSQSPDIPRAEERGVAPPNTAADAQGAARGAAKKARKVRLDKRRAAERAQLGPAKETSADPSGVELGEKRRADSKADGDMERAAGPPAGPTLVCPSVTAPAQHTSDAEPELAPAGSTAGEPPMPLPYDEIPTSATADCEEGCLPEVPMATESRRRTASKPRRPRTDVSRLPRF